MNVEDLLKMTFDEAMEASEKTGRPLYQKWIDAQYFKDLEKEYKKSKNKRIILEAVDVCALNDFDLPEWLKQAFRMAYNEVRAYRAGRWSEVFGPAHTKGAHLPAKREAREKNHLVYLRIREILNAEPETPIDGHLFERVGRELGIGGKTKVSEIYYKIKKEADDFSNHIPPL